MRVLRDQRIHRLLVAAARQLADLAPFAQHHHAMRLAQHLGDLRRDEQHRHAGARQLRHARIRSSLAAMSMPRVGSSRISSRGCVASQRASSTFCWLPPESWRTGVSLSVAVMPSAAARRAASCCCSASGRRRARPRRACSASTMFSRTDSSPTMPSVLRSSGQKASPCRPPRAGPRKATPMPSTRCCRHRGGPGRRPAAPARCVPSPAIRRGRRSRRRAMARSTGSMPPLRDTSMQFQQRWRGASRRQLAGRAPVAARREFASHHGGDQPGAIQLCRQVFAHQPAVAQHRHAIGDRVHLVQEMRDEQDGHALLAQLPHHREQPRHFLVIQAGGGFIQDQHARRDARGARDGHHLPDGHRTVAQRSPDVQIQPQRVQPRRAPATPPCASRCRHPATSCAADNGRPRCSRPPTGWGRAMTSWYTVLMPSCCASCGEAGRISRPSSVIVPVCVAQAPVSTRISEDLPAPFWPSSACTSPARRHSSTSSERLHAGKAQADAAGVQHDARVRGGGHAGSAPFSTCARERPRARWPR